MPTQAAADARTADARPRRTPMLLAWSGGKDSAWALHALDARADVEVVALLTTVDAGDGHVPMQGIAGAVLRAQAARTGRPLFEVPLPARAGNDVYEAAFADGLEKARRRFPGLADIAFGDLFLADIRQWREALCARLGWTAHFPLFGRDTSVLARAMVDGGLRAVVTAVDTTRLDAAFGGRAFDHALLDALPPGIDRCGENGEFHTLVVDGPMLAAPLAVVPAGTALVDGRFATTRFVLG